MLLQLICAVQILGPEARSCRRDTESDSSVLCQKEMENDTRI
jgi:hypothetical protein